MYKLSNLNDVEFEILAKDIMEVKLGVELHCFPRGRDKGIDLCDSNASPHIIIQVKHYINSTWSNLRASLKKEIEKVEQLNPKKYYVVCSIELTLENKTEIFNMFSKYMSNISNIVDKNEIDIFLNQEGNKKILKKNFKLWFNSVDFLSILQNRHAEIDCQEFIAEAQRDIKFFVQTKAYYDCLKKLDDTNVLIVTGGPGVGKSVLSKMIVLNYISKNYTFRYVTNQDIRDLKNTLSSSPETKEIILLDDFLGQNYLKIDEKLPNEIKTLISYIENSKSKKIIMNSRITILNEAKNRFLVFDKMIASHGANKYVIDLECMSYLEKAKILYNHLYFSGIERKYFEKIKQDKNYEKIIKHKNYNPRIIEHVTRPYVLESVEPDDYLIFIQGNLNNPSKVWHDEFNNRLNDYDRIFMNTLYSLTDLSIDLEILKEAYDNRIKRYGTTINFYEDVHKRLSDALVKNSKGFNIKAWKFVPQISVLNPSVNDYIRESLKNNENEQEEIIKHAVFIEQINKIMEINPKKAKHYFSHNEWKLKSISNQTNEYYLIHILKFEIKEIENREQIAQAFEAVCKNDSYMKEGIIRQMIFSDIMPYYSLEYILKKNIENALKSLNLVTIEEVFCWFEQNYVIDDSIDFVFDNAIRDFIEEDVSKVYDSELFQIISDTIEKIDIEISNEDSYYDIGQKYVEYYYDEIVDIFTEEIEMKVDELIESTTLSFDKSSIDLDKILETYEIENNIRSFAENLYYVDDSEDYKPLESFSKKEEWDQINDLFSRDQFGE